MEINREMREANDELNHLYERTRELDRPGDAVLRQRQPRAPHAADADSRARRSGCSAPGSVDKWQRDLKSVARNARTLLCHVNDLLDLTKIEAGRMGLALAQVDLARVVRVVAAHSESHADERGISLTVDAPGTSPRSSSTARRCSASS